MYLIALETADPETAFTQKDCLEIFRQSQARQKLRTRSVDLMEKILSRENGIQQRYFSYPEIETIFDATPEKLNRVFEESAPDLGSKALSKAMESCGLSSGDLDGLIVCTCTGYLCPGLSSYISEKLGLRGDCQLQDIVGMGCGAAIPTMEVVESQIRAYPDRKIAMIAVEVCSAAFYLDNDPGVIISACLFGDGAAATIWSGSHSGGVHYKADHFDRIHLPKHRQLLRFENSEGKLRNRLDRKVPQVAGKAVRHLFDKAIETGSIKKGDKIIPHTGGRDVLDSLQESLDLTDFPESRGVLFDHGNMSSPSVLYALKSYLDANPSPVQRLWLNSFGAGFSAYSCRLEKQS